MLPHWVHSGLCQLGLSVSVGSQQIQAENRTSPELKFDTLAPLLAILNREDGVVWIWGKHIVLFDVEERDRGAQAARVRCGLDTSFPLTVVPRRELLACRVD